MGTWHNWSSAMFLLLGIFLTLVPGLVRGMCTAGVQPNLTCISQLETSGNYPNIFFGLDQYATPPHFTRIPGQNSSSYMYEPSVGRPPIGSLFPPGLTEVTFTVEDICDNTASCRFNVSNPSTRLPVVCPEFGGTVPTDADSATHTFTTPTFGAGNVQLFPFINTYYYQGNLTVDISVAGEPNLGVGTHTITTIIADDVLNQTCPSTLIVKDKQQPTITCTDLTTTDVNDDLLSAVAASDNADASPTITFSVNPPFTPGTPVTVTATATDASGNSASCSFNLTVEAAVGTQCYVCGAYPAVCGANWESVTAECEHGCAKGVKSAGETWETGRWCHDPSRDDYCEQCRDNGDCYYCCTSDLCNSAVVASARHGYVAIVVAGAAMLTSRFF